MDLKYLALFILLFLPKKKGQVWTFAEVNERARQKGLSIGADEINIITNKANYYISYNGQNRELALETAFAEFGIL